MSSKNNDYEVGYGMPPHNSRFRKGVSGNPKGRPKGTQNVATVLQQTLQQRVIIIENGQRKTITKLEAALTQLINKAASGDLGALKLLVSLTRSEEERHPAEASEKEQFGEADQHVMESILKRFSKQAKENHDEV
jgi:ribosomal 50S subunit-associated protein YjgA (DUF615 family)